MLLDALVLATLSTIGFVMAWKKLPRKVRRFLARHGLLVDIITFLLTYFTLGSTLTALTAGAMVAIFTSMLLHISNNPNDFLYLYDLKNAMDEILNKTKTQLTEYGKQYREHKLEPAKVKE